MGKQGQKLRKDNLCGQSFSLRWRVAIFHGRSIVGWARRRAPTSWRSISPEDDWCGTPEGRCGNGNGVSLLPHRRGSFRHRHSLHIATAAASADRGEGRQRTPVDNGSDRHREGEERESERARMRMTKTHLMRTVPSSCTVSVTSWAEEEGPCPSRGPPLLPRGVRGILSMVGAVGANAGICSRIRSGGGG